MPMLRFRLSVLIMSAAFTLSAFSWQAEATEEEKTELASTGASPTSEEQKTSHVTQTGMASWYSGGFVGGKTANGERYRPGERTAAHRTLPFGTFVRVTNLRNNKSAVVRINNRGPYIRKRIIDLSRQAASDLAMLKSGTARVRLEVLSKEIAVAELASLRADN